MTISAGRRRGRRGAGGLAVLAGLALTGGLTACSPQFPEGAQVVVASVDGGRFVVSWPAATEYDAGQSVAAYRVAIDGTTVAEVPASSRSCLLRNAPTGAHTLTVAARDDQGEWSTTWKERGTLAATVTGVVAPSGPATCAPVGVSLIAADSSEPRISADATTVVVEGQHWTRRFARIDLITGAEQAFDWYGFADASNIWSVDDAGRRFAISTMRNLLATSPTWTESQVYRYEPATGAIDRASLPGVESAHPIISGDGRHLLWRRALSGGGTVLSVWSEGDAAPTEIATGSAGRRPCGISHDGTVVAYTEYGLGRTPTDPVRLYVWSADTGTTRMVTRTDAPNGKSGCTLSRDGSTVAVYSAAPDVIAGETHPPSLYRVDLATGAVQHVLDEEVFLPAPAISGNGDVIASTTGRIWTAGGGIVDLGFEIGHPTLDATGDHLAFDLSTDPVDQFGAAAYLWTRPPT